MMHGGMSSCTPRPRMVSSSVSMGRTLKKCLIVRIRKKYKFFVRLSIFSTRGGDVGCRDTYEDLLQRHRHESRQHHENFRRGNAFDYGGERLRREGEGRHGGGDQEAAGRGGEDRPAVGAAAGESSVARSRPGLEGAAGDRAGE